jgi:hypothetical protein
LGGVSSGNFLVPTHRNQVLKSKDEIESQPSDRTEGRKGKTNRKGEPRTVELLVKLFTAPLWNSWLRGRNQKAQGRYQRIFQLILAFRFFFRAACRAPWSRSSGGTRDAWKTT